MFFRKKITCKKNGKPCDCQECVAEVLRLKSLEALEQSREATAETKKAITNLHRAERMLKTGEYKLPLSLAKKTA
jgi:hypothetical protein